MVGRAGILCHTRYMITFRIVPISAANEGMRFEVVPVAQDGSLMHGTQGYRVASFDTRDQAEDARFKLERHEWEA